MYKVIIFFLLIMFSSTTFSNDHESIPKNTSNTEVSEIKEQTQLDKPSASQNPSPKEPSVSDKDEVSGCSDPDLEMLGLDYMCR